MLRGIDMLTTIAFILIVLSLILVYAGIFITICKAICDKDYHIVYVLVILMLMLTGCIFGFLGSTIK